MKKDKIKRKAGNMKKRLKDKFKGKPVSKTATAVTALIVVVVLALTGCQSADPASRSNRTAYGDITVRNSSNVWLTIGDGLLASADGGGDTQSNTPTQTTDTKPEIAVGVGGGSAGTGGAVPQSGIVGEALTKLMGILGGGSGSLTPQEAAIINQCVDGLCTP